MMSTSPNVDFAALRDFVLLVDRSIAATGALFSLRQFSKGLTDLHLKHQLDEWVNGNATYLGVLFSSTVELAVFPDSEKELGELFTQMAARAEALEVDVRSLKLRTYVDDPHIAVSSSRMWDSAVTAATGAPAHRPDHCAQASTARPLGVDSPGVSKRGA